MLPKLVLPGVLLSTVILIFCGQILGPVSAGNSPNIEEFVDSRDAAYAAIQQCLEAGPVGCRRAFPTIAVAVQPRLRDYSVKAIQAELAQGYDWHNTRRLIVMYAPSDEVEGRDDCLSRVSTMLEEIERRLLEADFRTVPTGIADCEEGCRRLSLSRNVPGRVRVDIDGQWLANEQQCMVELLIEERFGGSE